MSKGYVSIAEVQEGFGGVSPRTIYNWRKSNGFPEPVGPAKNLYPIEAVERFERENGMLQEVVNG